MKKVLSMILVVLVIITSTVTRLPMKTMAENNDAIGGETQILATAKWGENINCTLYEDGTLMISGTGEMYNFSSAPALSYNANNTKLKNKVKNVIIDSGITNIANWAFEGCRMLTDIKIPDTVTSIGFNAFMNCIKLDEIELPVNMVTIEYGTFANCKSLKQIQIPSNISEIATSAFTNCENLEEIIVSEENSSFGMYDDCLYSKDLSKLVFVPISKKRLFLAENIESIDTNVL